MSELLFKFNEILKVDFTPQELKDKLHTLFSTYRNNLFNEKFNEKEEKEYQYLSNVFYLWKNLYFVQKWISVDFQTFYEHYKNWFK